MPRLRGRKDAKIMDDVKSLKLTAPALRQLIYGYMNPLETKRYTEETMEKLKSLFDILKKTVKSDSEESELYKFWIRVPRGTIEDYGDPEMAIEYGEVKSVDEFEKNWEEEFPDEEEWFHFMFFRGDYAEVVNLNENAVISARMKDDEDGWKYNECATVDLFGKAVSEFVSMVRDGTYNDFVEQNMPLKYRYGKIKAAEYFEARPDVAKYERQHCNGEMLQKFVQYIKEDGSYDFNTEPDVDFMPEMTARKYIELSAIVYRNVCRDKMDDIYIADKRNKEPSDTDLYKRFADGRDGGLLSILMRDAPDDPEAFKKWFLTRDKWKVYDENDSHLWEALGRLHLVPCYVAGKGWYLTIFGVKYFTDEAAAMYVVLRDAGIPVRMYEADCAVKHLLWEDKVGFVPSPFWPSGSSSEEFRDSEVNTFVNLEDADAPLLDKIEWIPLRKVEPAEPSAE